jgi:uncharacterized protein YndB with AHSA1/START domain
MRAATATVKPSLTLQRRLDASPERVYAAWTDAEKIARWFGPSVVDQGTVKATMDVRVGGSFEVSFTTEDGEYHRVGGVYREVVPNRKLAFTWAWHTTPERESQVTVTIKPEGARSLLTLHHEQLFDEDARTGHARGWTGSLDKLEAMFA